MLFLGSAAAQAEGPFVGQFELKTLESEAGYLELQSQNAYSFGHPGRRVWFDPADGETEFDENTVIRLRTALEIEVGFSRYLKSRIGLELEDERVDDPETPGEANDFAGHKLTEIGGELIGVLVPRNGDGIGLGGVVELEHPVLSAKDEPNKLAMGPIIEVASGPWLFSATPMAVHFFGAGTEAGEAEDDKWDFAYAAQVKYTVSERWQLALEAYGTVDRIGDTGAGEAANAPFGDHDQHRLGPVLYHSIPVGGALPEAGQSDAGAGEGSEISIGVGFLAGLTEATPDGTVKLSVEFDY